MTPLLVASGNPHKVDEIRAILAPLNIEVVGLDALETQPEEPEENGDTFEANARLKACAYARETRRTCLADDSGLEVDALNGAPGVHSARFAGVDGTREERDAANNALLVQRLNALPNHDPAARFVCAMCIAASDGTVLAETRGTFEGVITCEPRGANGFGYDPYLFLPESNCTSAQMTAEAKNARSHRGAATRAMAAWLTAHVDELGMLNDTRKT